MYVQKVNGSTPVPLPAEFANRDQLRSLGDELVEEEPSQAHL
jgi:hypothetical protein